MNDKTNPSEDAKLSALLRETRATPELPPGFERNVWRRIERAEPQPQRAWLEVAAAWFLRPRLAVGGLAVVMILGVALGTFSNATGAKDSARVRYVTSVDPFQKAH
jgi:hypothetical protein